MDAIGILAFWRLILNCVIKFSLIQLLCISLQRATNGQVAGEKTSPAKKTLAAKAEIPKKTAATKGDDVDGKLRERKGQEDNKATTAKEKEQSSAKTGKENKVEQAKNKKNLKNSFQEKPVDFDDGWLIDRFLDIFCSLTFYLSINHCFDHFSSMSIANTNCVSPCEIYRQQLNGRKNLYQR